MKEFIKSLTATQRILILLLGVKNLEPIINHLRLQKEFFYSLLLMAKDQKEKEELLEDAGFYPHKVGPYSETLEEDVEQLSLAGIVEYKSTVKRAEDIKLTEKGREVFNYIIRETPEELIKILEESKDFLNDKNISDEEVLAIIYELEKEYTTKSDVIELIKRNKLKYAISLYKKGKISIERAAEIAGISVSEFKNFL